MPLTFSLLTQFRREQKMPGPLLLVYFMLMCIESSPLLLVAFGSSWQTLDAPCYSRQLQAAPDISWLLLVSWQILISPSYSWQLTVAPGYSWQLLAAPSSSWLLNAPTVLIPDSSWWLLTAPGCSSSSWHQQVAPNYPWQLMVAPGYSWQLLVAPSQHLAVAPPGC